MVELEHSRLVGEEVKFKTIVNFDRVLGVSNSLGVILVPQSGYKNRIDSQQQQS